MQISDWDYLNLLSWFHNNQWKQEWGKSIGLEDFLRSNILDSLARSAWWKYESKPFEVNDSPFSLPACDAADPVSHCSEMETQFQMRQLPAETSWGIWDVHKPRGFAEVQSCHPLPSTGIKIACVPSDFQLDVKIRIKRKAGHRRLKLSSPENDNWWQNWSLTTVERPWRSHWRWGSHWPNIQSPRSCQNIKIYIHIVHTHESEWLSSSLAYTHMQRRKLVASSSCNKHWQLEKESDQDLVTISDTHRIPPHLPHKYSRSDCRLPSFIGFRLIFPKGHCL